MVKEKLSGNIINCEKFELSAENTDLSRRKEEEGARAS